MSTAKQQKRNRLIALAFASILFVLTYGPLAPWFVATDRFLYDQLAAGVRQPALANGLIVSIDPTGLDASTVSRRYGDVLHELQSRVMRIDHSWERTIRLYERAYRDAIDAHPG